MPDVLLGIRVGLLAVSRTLHGHKRPQRRLRRQRLLQGTPGVPQVSSALHARGVTHLQLSDRRAELDCVPIFVLQIGLLHAKFGSAASVSLQEELPWNDRIKTRLLGAKNAERPGGFHGLQAGLAWRWHGDGRPSSLEEVSGFGCFCSYPSTC